jgi:hypothetical membrane protein
VAFLVLYAVAMAGDPEYTFFRNYLSDLGVGRAAWAFNSAVIVAGSLTYPFVLLGLRPSLGSGILVNLGSTMALVGATFLILVGVLTEDYDPEHYIVSVGFFTSMLVALGLLSWALHMSNALGRLATHLTEGVFVLGIILMAFGFIPETETIAVLSIVVWALAIAVILLREPAPTT